MDTEQRLSLPAKPAMVTAANGLGLAVAGIITGGTVAMVAAGTVALGTVAVVTKGTKAVKAHRQAVTGSSLSRRAAAKLAGQSARAGGKGAQTGGAGGRRAAGGSRTAAGPLAGSSRAARGSGGAAAGSSGRSAGSRGPGTSGRASSGRGSGSSGRGSGGSGSLAARARRMANSPARQWAAGRLASAGRALSSGAARTDRAVSSARRKAKAAWFRAFPAIRRWVQRTLLGRTPTDDVDPGTTRGRAAALDLKPNLSRGLLNEPFAPTFARSTPYALGSQPGAVSSCQGGTMLHHAREMLEYAANWEGRNLEEILSEIDTNCAPSLRAVAETFAVFSEKSRQIWGFDDSVTLKFSLISECLGTAASMADTLASDIEITEETALNNIRNPKVGAGLRDLSAHGIV